MNPLKKYKNRSNPDKCRVSAAVHISDEGRGFAAWICRRRLVRWLTSQPPVESQPDIFGRAAGWLTGLLAKVCTVLKLDRVLRNSVLLRPELWLLFTLLLLPFMPTMVMLVLAAVTLGATLLSRCMAQARPEAGSRFGIRLYSPALRLTGLLAVVYLLAIPASVDPSASLYPAVLIAFFMLFSFGSYGAVRRWSDLRRAFAVLAIGAVAVSLYGFYQWLNPAAFSSGWLDEDMFSSISFRVYSTFQNPNVLGEYFLLVIPFTLALALTAGNRKKKLLWGLAALLMCLCAVLTYSRGCYIGLALALVVFLVLLDRRFLIPVIILAVLSPLFLPASITERILSIGSTADTSTNYRVEIWIGVLDMLKHFWYSGVGPGETAFATVYPIYALEAVSAPHSHCLYLQLLCDTGISGLLIFLLAAVSLLRSLLTSLRHAVRRETQVFAAAGVAAICGFLLQSSTDYSFYNYRVLLLYFAMTGLCLLLRHEEKLLEGDGDAGRLAMDLTEERRPVILQILSDSNLGGAGRYLLNLFTAYDREKYAMVLVLPAGGAVAAEADIMGIPVIEADIPGESSLNLRSILELRRICLLLQPELVQTHGSLSGRIAARATRAKILYTRHSVFPVSGRLQKGPGHVLSAWVNRYYGDLALAVSPAAAENLREIGVKSEAIVTVMNGVKAPEADPEHTAAFCRSYGLRPDIFTAGIFARLEEYKGHDTILEAASILKQEQRRLQIIICGAGPRKEHICKQIRALKLEDTIFFCGYQSHPADAMAAVSVQLNASTGTEATSLALIEGMSMGLATIASSYGGTPYLIHDGQEGLLFAPGDAEGLADCLRRVMDDNTLCLALGETGRRSYLQHYTAEAFAAQLQRIYDQLLGKEAGA